MKSIIRWIPVGFVMGFIFLFSSIPSDEMPGFGLWDFLIKKGGHVLGYGILAVLVWYALGWNPKRVWLAFLTAVLYALSDEFHQSFVPGRNASFLDVLLFDGGGAVILLSITALIIKKKTDKPGS